MSNGLNRDDMKWITRNCKLRATVPQLFEVIREYQDEIEFRYTGDETNDDTEDNNQ